MAGLGFGSSKQMTTPEGFTEGSISWKNISLAAIDGVADTWFEEYKPVPLTQTLRKGALDADPKIVDYANDFAFFLVGENEPLVIPNLEINLNDLGEQIDLTEGTLGPAIIATLEGAGVIWRYETMFPLNHAQSVEFPNDKTLGISQWQSYFGLPLEQMFRVFRNAAGKETCLWSSKMLAATRPFEHLTTREIINPEDGDTYTAEVGPGSIAKGALTFGEWSTKFFIPEFAKRLFYLAETPFPSNVFMSFGRNLAFGEEVAPENYPRPVIINSPQTHARGAFDFDGSGGYLASGTIMPHVVEMGWTFSTTNQEEILKILGVITDGLTRITSILEDGFLNYRTDEYGYPYDDVLLSATKFNSDYVQGGDAQGLSYWIPVVRLGIALNESNQRAADAVDNDNVKEQWWVASNGVGMFVPNAINSLVFSSLIPEGQWGVIDQFLDASVRMNVLNESTNSLSNWGIAKFKQGLVEEAIDKFEEALARPDKFSEAEASYWLSEIWKQKGDSAKAAQYRARCDAAGGYDPGTGFGPSDAPASAAPSASLSKSSGEGSGLSKSSAGGLGGGLGGVPTPTPAAPAASAPSSLAAFCGQCGTKFEVETAKFCGNCGSPR